MKRFIASNATVIGDVTLSEDVTIWYQAVLRGNALHSPGADAAGGHRRPGAD